MHPSAHDTPLHFLPFLQPGPIRTVISFPQTIFMCTHREAFEMSNYFQFLSYYMYGPALGFLFIPIESEIHKSSFEPANPLPSFPSSDFFPRIQILGHVYFSVSTTYPYNVVRKHHGFW